MVEGTNIFSLGRGPLVFVVGVYVEGELVRERGDGRNGLY